MNRRIVLCAGHGAGDSGAVGQGRTEAAEVIDIVNRTADRLRADGQVEVVVVPHELDFVQGINWVNARYKNLEDGFALEVHKNATVGAKGVETWFFGGDGQSQHYGQIIVDHLAAVTGLPNRGTKPDTSNRWGRLGWIRDTNPWAILVEAGFISDGGDPVGPAANDQYAEGLKNGCLAVLGLSPKPAPVPVPTPPPAVVNFRVIGNDGKQIGAYKTDTNAWNKYKAENADNIMTSSGQDVTAQLKAKFEPATPPPAIPTPPAQDENKNQQEILKMLGEQNTVLAKILEIVTAIWQKIAGVFK